MNKQELIKKIKDISLGAGDHGDTKNEHESEYALIAYILDLVNRLDEPQDEKVEVPDFVAEWIQKCQKLNWNLSDLFAPEIFDSTFAVNTKEWLRQDKQNYDILARAWLDGYDVEEEPKWTVNEGDLVVRRGEHETKIYFVEAVHEDGILLVNGIKDEFFTDLVDRSIDEESVSYFYKNFRLLAKKENLEVEKV